MGDGEVIFRVVDEREEELGRAISGGVLEVVRNLQQQQQRSTAESSHSREFYFQCQKSRGNPACVGGSCFACGGLRGERWRQFHSALLL